MDEPEHLRRQLRRGAPRKVERTLNCEAERASGSMSSAPPIAIRTSVRGLGRRFFYLTNLPDRRAAPRRGSSRPRGNRPTIHGGASIPISYEQPRAAPIRALLRSVRAPNAVVVGYESVLGRRGSGSCPPRCAPVEGQGCMRAHSLAHLSDGELLRDLAALLAHDRTTTAALLAHLAEVDARRLYLPAAYPSMFAYCVHELRLSEDAAYKRIQAARIARQFPIIFDAVADGRLHLSGVVMLAPYLTAETAAPLLQAAAHKTKSEIELLVAERFPRSEMLALVEAIPGSPPTASRDL